jgi:short subunit dehydrogenase-like uncharacterized protein
LNIIKSPILPVENICIFPIVLKLNAIVNYIYLKKVLTMITKLPPVILIVALHEEKEMSLIRSHIKRLARALYRKPVTGESSQIQELGHYYPSGGKYLRPLSLLAR